MRSRHKDDVRDERLPSTHQSDTVALKLFSMLSPVCIGVRISGQSFGHEPTGYPFVQFHPRPAHSGCILSDRVEIPMVQDEIMR